MPAEPADTETERALAAAILADVLEVGEVGRATTLQPGGDSIRDSGGARARDGGIPLTARMVFEHPCFVSSPPRSTPSLTSRPMDDKYAPMSTSGLSTNWVGS